LLLYPNTSINQKLAYPKIPLPHPGQSYNPSQDDLAHLVHKVIQVNKRPELTPQEKEDIEEKKFESEEDVPEKEFKVSNNPPVDDYTQRKSKTEKNRLHRKKLNIIKENETIRKKQNRIKLSNAKSLKTVEKQRKRKENELLKKQNEMKKKAKETQALMKVGVVEDPELLEDFKVKKKTRYL